MAYTAWRGAIEITVGGIPVPVNIALQNRTKTERPSGFKLVSPEGLPVKQQYVTDDESWSGTIGECGKGVPVGETIQMLKPEALKAIGENERSRMVEPDSFAPIESLDLALALGSYNVVPDDKVAGAERQVSVVWNGLRYAKLAYITRIVARAGSMDRIFAIYADDAGLRAVTLPFANEVKDDEVQADYEVNEAVGEMFAKAIQAEYTVAAFDPADHASEYLPRREQLLDQALAGETIAVAPVAPKSDVPDLMAALTASMEQVKAEPKPKAKGKKAKVAA